MFQHSLDPTVNYFLLGTPSVYNDFGPGIETTFLAVNHLQHLRITFLLTLTPFIFISSHYDLSEPSTYGSARQMAPCPLLSIICNPMCSQLAIILNIQRSSRKIRPIDFSQIFSSPIQRVIIPTPILECDFNWSCIFLFLGLSRQIGRAHV